VTELSGQAVCLFYLIYIDGPPPAYEVTPTSNNNPGVIANEDVGAGIGVIEAPPPYCLVDPTKIRNMDHLPHYPHISPVEIIDLNTNSSLGNEQVKRI